MEFEKTIWNKTFFLFDEVDEISDPFKCELVYPSGLEVKSNFESNVRGVNLDIKLILDIYSNFIKTFFIKERCQCRNCHLPSYYLLGC